MTDVGNELILRAIQFLQLFVSGNQLPGAIGHAPLQGFDHPGPVQRVGCNIRHRHQQPQFDRGQVGAATDPEGRHGLPLGDERNTRGRRHSADWFMPGHTRHWLTAAHDGLPGSENVIGCALTEQAEPAGPVVPGPPCQHHGLRVVVRRGHDQQGGLRR